MVYDLSLLNAIVEKAINFLESLGYFDDYKILLYPTPEAWKKIRAESLRQIILEDFTDETAYFFYENLDKYKFFHRQFLYKENNLAYLQYTDFLTAKSSLYGNELIVPERINLLTLWKAIPDLLRNEDNSFNILLYLNPFIPENINSKTYLSISIRGKLLPMFISKEPVYINGIEITEIPELPYNDEPIDFKSVPEESGITPDVQGVGEKSPLERIVLSIVGALILKDMF